MQIWSATALAYTTTGQVQPTYLRIWNISTATGAITWASRNGQPAVVGAPGSYPLYRGDKEIFVEPGPVPINALSIIGAAPGVELTIEVA